MADSPQSRQITVEDLNRIIAPAVETYGIDHQIDMLFEEMSELQDALCKLRRGREAADHVCEEIADVMVMCHQMAHYFGKDKVDLWIMSKLIRLEDRINSRCTMHD